MQVLWLFALLLAAACSLAAPPPMDTGLNGTWSSGMGYVTTGQDFFDLMNNTFKMPQRTGISYSFLETNETSGFWEQALYQYHRTDNPDCFIVQLIWQHGTYTVHANHSMSLDPFKTDGLQQYTDTCKGVKNRVQYYSQPEFMRGFEITTYNHYTRGANLQWSYKLQMYEFDGAPKPPMYLTYRPAQMYPPQGLHKFMWGLMG